MAPRESRMRLGPLRFYCTAACGRGRAPHPECTGTAVYLSPIAWISLAILWFGVSDASPTFLIFLSSFFPVVVATTSGVHLVEQQYIRVARHFEVGGFRLFRQVIFLAALPQLITGMRVGLSVAWLVVVAAEMMRL
jgi:NitT/TauT family transport system permease protein